MEKNEKERNKNYRSILFRSYLMRNRKFHKNSKKIKKKRKRNTIMVHFKPKLVGHGCEVWKIKIIVSFRSYPKRNRKFHKNNKKFKK